MWDNIIAASLVCGTLIVIFWVVNFFLQRQQVKKSKRYFEDLEKRTKVGAKVILLNGIVGQIASIDNDYVGIKIAPNVTITCVRFSIKQIIG